MKTCTKCHQSKPLDEFYEIKASKTARTSDGRFAECKQCNRARALAHLKASRARDPEGHARKRRVWTRSARLRQYGMTEADYNALLSGQGGGCAICGTTEAGAGGGQLPVDHDHETGEVRGLLCHNCNSGLGRFGDDPDRLIAAASYLLVRRSPIPTGQVF